MDTGAGGEIYSQSFSWTECLPLVSPGRSGEDYHQFSMFTFRAFDIRTMDIGDIEDILVHTGIFGAVGSITKDADVGRL